MSSDGMVEAGLLLMWTNYRAAAWHHLLATKGQYTDTEVQKAKQVFHDHLIAWVSVLIITSIIEPSSLVRTIHACHRELKNFQPFSPRSVDAPCYLTTTDHASSSASSAVHSRWLRPPPTPIPNKSTPPSPVPPVSTQLFFFPSPISSPSLSTSRTTSE